MEGLTKLLPFTRDPSRISSRCRAAAALGERIRSLERLKGGVRRTDPWVRTPAAYPRCFEFHRFDIQSTGQESHCVNTLSGHRKGAPGFARRSQI